MRATTRLPNGCYTPLNSFKEVEGNDLTLYNVATYPKDAACPRIVEYKSVVFDVNNLEPGDYRIVDGDDGAVLGELKKSEASIKIDSNLK